MTNETPTLYKFYITKYALTNGIIERDGYAHPEPWGAGMLCCPVENKTPGQLNDLYHGEGRDWHKTREAAVVKAEQMRVAKIASLKKQINKLATMKF